MITVERWFGFVAALFLGTFALIACGGDDNGTRDAAPATTAISSTAAPATPVRAVEERDAPGQAAPPSNTWSRVPHDEAVFGGEGSQVMNSVTAGGPGVVAVGSDERDAAVWTSPDGHTWSRVPRDQAAFSGDGSRVMKSVTAGGPGVVAVGSDTGAGLVGGAAVWTSVDGIAWSRLPHDEAALGGEGNVMNSVTAGGPGLVAVGSDCCVSPGGAAAVWTSADGITWSRVPHDEAVFGGSLMSSVTAGGPGLVAVGSDQSAGDVGGAAVWTSADGITWSRVPHDEAVFGGGGSQIMNSVTAGGPGLVAVGSDFGPGGGAAVWTSADGITWSRVPHDEAVFGRGGVLMVSVTVGGPGLVAVGFEGSRPQDWNAAVWVAGGED